MRRGFTLIELLVVISIISLLSSVVFSSVNTARFKARDARRMSDLRNLQLALELYRDANGLYPVTTVSKYDATHNNWDLRVTHSADLSWTDKTTAGTIANLLAPYMSTLPTDPVNSPAGIDPWWGGLNYMYISTNGSDYDLVTSLEDHNSLYRCEVKGYRYHVTGAYFCLPFAATPIGDATASRYLYSGQ